MLKTIILLLTSIILIPYIAFQYDQSLQPIQYEIIKTSSFIMLGFAIISYIVSEISGNYSQTDKLWSITPIIFSWYYAYATDFDCRVVLMAVLVTIWGIRLTYNFARRGAYKLKFWEGHEDYRWEILRQKPFFNKKWKWSLFNLLFISFYQHFLIWLFTLPAILSYNPNKRIGISDFILALVYLAFVILETISDQQQWNFQNEKHRRINNKEPLGENYGKGFVHTGLWSIVRHPNYACEQLIWIAFYCFTILATGRWVNVSMVGSVLLILLFKGSSDFSESISSEKYPEYKQYCKNTPRFIPKLFK